MGKLDFTFQKLAVADYFPDTSRLSSNPSTNSLRHPATL